MAIKVKVRVLKENKLAEDCWDGYEHVPGTQKGAPGSCRKKTNEAEEPIEEGEICDKGISYVMRTDPGGKDIKRGKDGKLKNWSARAAQIASKKCKDPDYGTGKSKKKNESLSDKDEEELEIISKELDKASKMHKGQSDRVEKIAKKIKEEKKNCGCGQDPCKTYGIQTEAEGGLKAWEKENWTHSDGTPCGGGKKDGSKSRCKPASKWKTMSKSEKAADNAKKAKGTKAGKQYVPATKKGKVTKSHTKRNESVLDDIIRQSVMEELEDLEEKKKKKKKCKPSKGKRFAKRVDGKCRSYGQAGKAKDGGDRIRPGTKKAHAYCARSAGIKKCKNPPCANTLSRKKWKCKGKRSVPE